MKTVSICPHDQGLARYKNNYCVAADSAKSDDRCLKNENILSALRLLEGVAETKSRCM